MATVYTNKIPSYYDSSTGKTQSLTNWPNRFQLTYSYAYNSDGKYTISWEVYTSSAESATSSTRYTKYYSASINVAGTNTTLISSPTNYKKDTLIGQGSKDVNDDQTVSIVLTGQIAQNGDANKSTKTVSIAIPLMPYLKVQYYSNYATEAFDGAANPVSATTNVHVKTAYFYRDQNYSGGLHNYSAVGDGVYLARKGYTATRYWGSSASGGTKLKENDGNKTGADLATHFGKNISKANATQKLYAQWTPNEYTITLDKNGGSGGTSKTWLLYDTQWQDSNDAAITSIGSIPTKTGNVFLGYYTKSSGGTKIINANKTFVSNKLTFTAANTTLYAHWEESKLTLKYYANNATSGTLDGTALTANELNNTEICCPNSVITYTEKPSAGLANTNNSSYLNLSRTGYTTGEAWSASTNGSNPVSHDGLGYSGADYATAFGGDITNKHQTIKIYAVWIANTYTVNYNGNGATGGSTASSSHTYDTAKKLTANGFTRVYTVTYNYNGNGSNNTTATATYTFKDWNKNAAGTSTSYSNQQSVKNLTSTNKGTVNLYAQWNSASVTLPTPTRTGYSFKGWYDAASGGTKIGNGGASYTPTANITLYAQWTAHIATIYYYANGGTANTEGGYLLDSNERATNSSGTLISTYINYDTPTNVYDVSTLFLPPTGYHAPLSTTDYYNSGWRINGATSTTYATQKKYDANTYLTTGNATLNFYARWIADTYTVTFNPQGGSVSPTSKSVTYNSTYGTLPTPTREGYEFLGWYTSETGGSKITDSTVVKITANQTLYAHWDPLGLVRIWNGSSFQLAIPYVYNEGWKQAMGYIYKNSTDGWQFGV